MFSTVRSEQFPFLRVPSRQATLVVAGLIAVAAFAPIFLRRPLESDWYRCYVHAAERMQAGETIHVVEPCPYAYPPIMALLTIPLAVLPTSLGFAGWYLVNVVAFGLLLRSAWRLADGPTWRHGTARWWCVAALGLLLVSRYIVGTLETRQFDLVIGALLMTGLERVRNGTRTGAALLGLAAGMKCTPLLFVPYLFWRGQTRSAIIVAVVAAACNFVPDVLYPQQSGRLYLQDWREEFLAVSQQVPPGTWFSGLIQNQSIAGASQRLFRYGLPTSLDAVRTGKLAPADVPRLRVVVAAVSLLLLAATAWCIGRPRFNWRCGNVAASHEDRRRFAVEASAVLALMILLSPMSSRAHLSILLLPAWLICRSALVDGRRGGRYLIGVLLILGPFAAKGFVGKSLGELALAWSFPGWFALTTLAGMGWLSASARIRSNSNDSRILAARFSGDSAEVLPQRQAMVSEVCEYSTHG